MVVYKGLGYNEAGRVPHSDYVYLDAISTGNTLLKFNGNRKRLRGSNKKLYNIKCIILASKLYRSGM